MIRSMILAGLTLVSPLFSIEPSKTQIEETERAIAFFSLDWKEAGTYSLSKSGSTLIVPDGYKVLLGEEAKKPFLIDKIPPKKNIEAAVYDLRFENLIIFENDKNGYVSLDGWKDIDPKTLLDAISKGTEEANEERRKNGASELHIVGWLQEPTLDRLTNTVYLAIEVKTDDSSENFVNSIALKLGREGFEQINWLARKADYSPFGGKLDVMLKSHSFDPGHRYTDYINGDKLARYGIASLIAATAGAKAIKASGLFILFKKVGGFLFAGLAAIFYQIKKIFGRKKNEDEDQKNPKIN